MTPAKRKKKRSALYGTPQDEPFISERFQNANPLRIARLARDLSQQQLSELTGVTRVTITRIETGRSVGAEDTCTRIEQQLSMTPGTLNRALRKWQASFDPLDFVAPRGRAWLNLPPEGVPEKFTSWTNWRQNVIGTTSALARLLQISDEVIRDYEREVSERGQMPRALIAALSQRLGLSAEYIRELVLLPIRSNQGPKQPIDPRPRLGGPRP